MEWVTNVENMSEQLKPIHIYYDYLSEWIQLFPANFSLSILPAKY
jgi:hypothetical protein